MTHDDAMKLAHDMWGPDAFVVLEPPQVGYWLATGDGDAYVPIVRGRGATLREACEAAHLA